MQGYVLLKPRECTRRERNAEKRSRGPPDGMCRVGERRFQARMLAMSLPDGPRSHRAELYGAKHALEGRVGSFAREGTFYPAGAHPDP